MTDNASRSRARWLLVLLALTATLFLVVASACGGDDDDDDGGDDGGATATESTDGGDDGGDDGGEETPADNGDDGGDLSAQLQELSENWADVSGQITYKFTSDGEETVMTFYADPPDKSRTDFVTDDGTTAIITNGDTSYICTEVDGVGTCLASPADGSADATLPFFNDFADPDSIENAVAGANLADAEKFDEKVAGVDATCFRISGDFQGDEGSATWCFSDEGLLLRAVFEGSTGEFSMEATEIGEITDDDFEPPFDVLDIGDIGQP